MMDNMMIDIETMGNCQNSVICSIGAVEFDMTTGQTGKEFYQRVDIQSCLDSGLEVNASTIYWWLKQNEKARLELGVDTISLEETLIKITDFIAPEGDTQKYKVWGNPASFDLGILSNAYDKTGWPVPWFYRNERDMRTLVGLAPHIKDGMPKQGTEHHPIDDCKFQIEVCCKTMQNLTHAEVVA